MEPVVNNAIDSRNSEHKPNAQTFLLRMVLQAMAAKTVNAAAELGIADLLADGPLTSYELADKSGTHHQSLHRLLLALAGLGVLTCVDNETFTLAELGRPLRSDVTDSVLGLVRTMTGPEVWRSWGEMVPSVRSGKPGWDLAYQMNWLDYYSRDPEPSTIFNLAMAEQSRDAAPGIIAAAGLSRFRTVVDIGGGDGTLIAQILQAEQQISGIVFDRSTGLCTATTRLEAAGVADRCQIVTGDFFDSIPAGADAYLLKQILHDWNDKLCLAILRNVRAAIPSHGRLLILERTLPDQIIPGDGAGIQSLLLDLHMLVVTGGCERTEGDFGVLLQTSGFELVEMSPPIPPFDYRVLEARPV
ncbi:methyltransferase [Nocardia sp. CA-128927]|uniref:methyltransferase n=1 Tax=Nocardia sp. CA-128927 TaxID=3239975 RepID=UPI003D98FB0D